jgi:hypothetical protein
MRSLCLVLILLLSVFSLSIGFSTALYTGLYLFLIPVSEQEAYIPLELARVD